MAVLVMALTMIAMVVEVTGDFSGGGNGCGGSEFLVKGKEGGGKKGKKMKARPGKER